MADEAIGGDLEPLAGGARSGSVHGSQDRGRTDLASHSAPNKSRSSEHAARFENATPAGISRGLESGTGVNTVVPAGRRHPERDPNPNRVAGPYGCVGSSRATCPSKAAECARLSGTASACTG